jgi:DNA-binding response OmpR family regulator
VIKTKILIIDDDEEICEEMSGILEDEGYLVNKVFDGLKASEMLEKEDYDLLLLDLKIPGLSGLDILKSVKDKALKTKVLVVTGRPLRELVKTRVINAVEEDKEDKILKLADGYINKPFDVEVLLDIIRELIG